jgi:hypothetical protein
MNDFPVVYYIVRAGLGAVAGFLAILYWPRNRDAAWVLIIVGTLLYYLSLIFELLVRIKLFVPEMFVVFGFPVFDIVSIILGGAPFLLFAIAFLIKVIRD